MSQALELPDTLYDALEKAAAASGTTPQGWIAARLPLPPPANGDEAKSLGERLAPHVGRIHSGGKDHLSENCGEKFADYLEQKRREGRL
jgi:hypothetical protein